MSDLEVIRKGKGIRLNSGLIAQQQCHGNIERIKLLHSLRLLLEECMENTNDPDALHAMDNIYDFLEYQLQEQWNFPRSNKFFRFWDRPKCSCPRLDNMDSYPSGIYTISGGCIVHSQKAKQQAKP